MVTSMVFFILGIEMPPKIMQTALKAEEGPRFLKISAHWGKNVSSQYSIKIKSLPKKPFEKLVRIL